MRSRLTYSNVIATVALFLALGGGAVAAFKLKKNSVGSAQIKPNAVRGADVNEASLAKVPSADSLDGRDGTEIERRLRFNQVAVEPAPEFTDLFTLGAFRFQAKCILEGVDPHLVLEVEDVGGGAAKTGSISTATNPDHNEGPSDSRERFLSLEPTATVLDLDGSISPSVGTATLGLSAPDQTVTGNLWFDVFPYTPPDGPLCDLNGTLSLAR